jgi:hypothetical protein
MVARVPTPAEYEFLGDLEKKLGYGKDPDARVIRCPPACDISATSPDQIRATLDGMTTPENPEIAAMRTAYLALVQLDEAGLRRAMRWLMSWFKAEHTARTAATANAANLPM